MKKMLLFYFPSRVDTRERWGNRQILPPCTLSTKACTNSVGNYKRVWVRESLGVGGPVSTGVHFYVGTVQLIASS